MKLDLSNKSLRKIEPLDQFLATYQYDMSVKSNTAVIEIALFDNNSITKLDNLESYTQLKQISLINNHLVELKGIAKLQNLQYLNLLNNSLINIDGN